MPNLYASAALGTEDLVAHELKALGFGGVRYAAGGAQFRVAAGEELAAAMRACLHLRAALRVLWPLAEAPCPDAGALYAAAAAVAWEEVLTPSRTFAVSATTSAAPPLAHAPFLAQRVKDAVVDRLRGKRGARPDVSRDDPDVRIYAHVAAPARDGGTPTVTLGLDASGRSLHLRGYRVAQTEAPLRETLAAAVLLATGWRAERPLLDPMCGSGTIAIEAALMAARVAPGLAAAGHRRSPRAPDFGFTRWPIFDDAARTVWRRLCDEAAAAALPAPPVEIHAADRDPDALAAARRNAAAAGPAAAAIRFTLRDVRETPPLEPPGVIVSNPPYGERLAVNAPFYRSLAAGLRTLAGHTAFLLLPTADAPRLLGMRPTWQRRLKNGPLTVHLSRFELGRQRQRSAQQRKPVE